MTGKDLLTAMSGIDGRYIEEAAPAAAHKTRSLHRPLLIAAAIKLEDGGPVCYRPYVCARQCLGRPVTRQPSRLTVVEGSYSCHPDLWSRYDLRVFLTVDPREQLRRIEVRNGPEKAQQFRDRWIPLEELYFRAFDVESRCDLRILL